VTVHDLKTHPKPFSQVWDRIKPFEIRKNDRNYEIGDILFLREYDPKEDTYSGRIVVARVTIVYKGPKWGIQSGYCVLGIFIQNETHNCVRCRAHYLPDDNTYNGQCQKCSGEPLKKLEEQKLLSEVNP